MSGVIESSQPDAKKLKLATEEKPNNDISSETSSDALEKGDSAAAGGAEGKTVKLSENGDGSPTDKFNFKFSTELSLEKIRDLQAEFAKERDWDQYHSPRNIFLAMVGEVGETAEHFQWKSETEVGLPGWSEKERSEVGDELSDVLIYLVRLAHVCHIDLPTAVLRKFEKNAQKYPAKKVYGSSKKYNEYKE